MKNIEKFSKEISNLVNKGSSLECSIATVAGIREEKPCFDQVCKECHNKCIEWMCSEYNEPILSDEEKDIIKQMIEAIHKFGCTVIAVRKRYVGCDDYFIRTTFKSIVNERLELMDSPYFNNDMFKGMEIDKEYKLEELGITCQTQKHS